MGRPFFTWGAMDYALNPTRLAALIVIPVAPRLDPDFTQPTLQSLQESQLVVITEGRNTPKDRKNSTRLYVTINEPIFIPANYERVQMCNCMKVNCGRGRKRGAEAIFYIIADHFW